jgi:hypothetical protein
MDVSPTNETSYHPTGLNRDPLIPTQSILDPSFAQLSPALAKVSEAALRSRSTEDP